jgi:preprotein translocase subunit SecY
VFALGIMPYITASIIIQLLGVVIPRFEQLKKEGQAGRHKLTQYTRYLTIGWRAAVDRLVALARNGQLFPSCTVGDQIINGHDALHLITMVVTMTAGTASIMWMGELITDRGIGNGMSILIFTSIAARIPAEGQNILQLNGGVVFGVIVACRLGDHRDRGVRRAGPAPAAGAVREADDRPPDVRRHLHLPPAEGQPGRRDPGDLRRRRCCTSRR